MFLEHAGAAATYSDRSGRPRLWAPPLAVRPLAKELAAALPGCAGRGGLTAEQDAQFWDYVTHAAQFMVNTMEDLAGR